ncbi:hypothetical protein CGGC5_v013372 [Colletotrichum fructicola Nara gc5]|uniref:Uncharacterized protein n=1 Tax=Colletotrichum fructicola (strain Nara gc5) TaxID=1213859 RepID=A0A7J6INW9_COLFN|nr:hypothetical protein CGGC5_v013372 [Colletotrichum fructicola Nara gc5]
MPRPAHKLPHTIRLIPLQTNPPLKLQHIPPPVEPAPAPPLHLALPARGDRDHTAPVRRRDSPPLAARLRDGGRPQSRFGA